MDLDYTPEEQAFRDEVRAFVRANLPQDIADKVLHHRRLVKDDLRPLAEDPLQEGLARRPLAARVRRPRLDAGADAHLRRGVRRRRRPAPDPVRPQHGRAGDHGVRHPVAEGALPAADPVAGGLLVPGLLGARLRVRPRIPEDARRARGRPLRRQRPEDLDDDGALRRHDLLPRAHRPDGEEAGGHQLPADQHALAGHHGAAARHHRRGARGERGVLRQREGAAREPGRRRKARAGPTRSTCSATSAPASPASAPRSASSRCSRSSPRSS